MAADHAHAHSGASPPRRAAAPGAGGGAQTTEQANLNPDDSGSSTAQSALGRWRVQRRIERLEAQQATETNPAALSAIASELRRLRYRATRRRNDAQRERARLADWERTT